MLLSLEAYRLNGKYGGTFLAQVDEGLRQALNQPFFSQVISGHEDTVRSVAYSTDGSLLASTSDDHTIRLWELANPIDDPIILLGHEDTVRSVAFSTDGSLLASASDDSTIRIWDLTSPAILHDPLWPRGACLVHCF